MFASRFGIPWVAGLSIALSSVVTGQGNGESRPPVRGPGTLTTGLPGNIIKTVTDLNGGTVLPGDTLAWDVTATNVGGPNDARFVVVLDTIPTNTTYVLGSLLVTAGANAGPKTDAIGDDQAAFESAFNRVRFRVGVGANATQGGTLVPNASTSVRFRVVVNNGVPGGTLLSNIARVRFNDAGSNVDFLILSTPPGGPVTGAPTTVPVSIPDLTLAKSHTGNFVRGSTGTYTLAVANAGPGVTAGTYVVSDVVPAGLTPTLAVGSGWSCSIVSQTVTCTSSASITAGGSAPPITLTVSVAVGAPGSITNTATVSGGGETNAGNNTASDPTTIVDPAIDLSIAKSHVGNFVGLRQDTFTLTVTNESAFAGSGPITVTDTLATGVTYVSGTGSGWTCGSAGQVVTCTNPGPIGANATTTITLTVHVGATAFPGFTNRAWVAHPGDPVPANDVATDVVVVESIPDFAITKTAGGAFVVGSQATYTIGIVNLARLPSTGVTTVTDTLPTGLAYVNATGPGWTCGAAGQVVTCTQPPGFPSGASLPITLTVDVLAAALPSVTNRVYISSPGDVNAPNNSATVTTPVTNPSGVDLTVAKAHTGNFTVGQNGQYVLRVTNSGSSTFTGTLTLVDTLPAGLTFVSAGVGCSASGQVVTCPITTTLIPGEARQRTITVSVGPSAFPAVTNRVHVSSPGDGNPNNNTAADPTTVVSTIDLTIAKTATSVFTVGSQATYALQISNVGPVATLGSITVTDTLPAGLTFVSGTGAGWSCSAAGQVTTCTNAGPLAPAASSTITLTVAVAAAAAPSVTNTAHVATPADAVSGNNSSTVVTPVGGGPTPDLAIAKSATSTFTVGSSATYSLVVTNVSTVGTTGATTVTDTLPAGLTFSSGTGTGWSCSASGAVVTCSHAGTIAAGGSTSITLTVAVGALASPSVTNRAHVATPGDANPANNTGTALTPVVVPGAPNLGLVKSHSGNFVVGQPGTYTLSISNTGTGPTTGIITVTDTLPTGLSFASGTGTGWSCSASGQIVTCTNPGPLAVSASTAITLSVNVGAAAIPSVINRATVGTPGDTDPSNDVGSDPTTVVSIPDLTIVKSATSPFSVGSNATYQFTVSNVSSGPTTGTITVTDVLPAGLTYQSFSGAGWSCSAVAQTVTCTNPAILAASASSAVSITVAVSAPASPSVTNTATVSTPGDVNGANNSSTITTPVASPTLDVSIAKALVGTLVAGQNATYSLTVLNNSTQPTTGTTTVTDVLPAGLTFVSATSSGASCTAAGQSVTCTRTAILAAGQSFTITLQVAVSPAAIGSITNTATVTTPGDVNAVNDSASVTTPVTSGIDLAIAKSSSALAVGSTGTFTLTVSNVGTSPTTGTITVTDNLPVGITFVSGSGTGFGCAAVGQLVTCTRTSVLAPGQSVVLSLVVNVSSAALPSIVNTATVATLGDAVSGNNTASTGPVPVAAPKPDLNLSKTLVTPAVAGANATFRLAVTNIGNGATSGTITITDVLQAGLTFVSGTGPGWSCVAAGQTVTCSNPGPLAPGGTSTVDLVVAIAVGVTSISNTATVVVPGDGNPGNDTGGVLPTPTTLPPDLTLTKVASGAFTVGQPASYTLTVRNTGGGPTTGPITITDAVPTGLTVTGTSGNGWTCSVAGQVVTCSHPGPLPPNGTLTLTIAVMPTAAAVPSVTNTATVATPGDSNPGNNDGSVTTPVAGVIDLALTKQGADTLVVGAQTSYTLTVRNVGNVPTTAPIVVTDSLPAGLTFQGASGTGFTCSASGQLVTCTRTAPPLGAGESVTLTVTATVTADAPASVRNVACVRTSGDTNTTNDCGIKVSTPLGTVDLVALKDVVGPVEVGRPATFTLAVRNIGTAPARPPITMVDTLPAGLTFVSASGSGWQCGTSGNVVTCIRPTALPPGLSPAVTLTVNVTAAAFPRVTNCMVVRGTNETGSLINNRSCSDPVVAGVGELEIEKRVSRAEVQVGDVVDYTVVVKNTGLGDVTDAIVTDVLPAGFLLELQSVRVNGAGGVLVPGAPGPRLTFEVGRVPAKGQVTLTYRVRVGPGARSGQQVNVAVAASKSRGGETQPARATVRVSGGVFDERGAIVGKVFVQCDCERQGMQDVGEVGIPGVRVYLEDGTSAVTDVEGKYNVYNVSSRLHVVKIDRTTLPGGAVLVPLVNRNAGDGYTRFADVKAGELHRADFADGSRSPEVLKAVLARRRTGEVNNAGEPAQAVAGYAPRSNVTDRELSQAAGDAARARANLVVATDSIVAIPPAFSAVSGLPVQAGPQAPDVQPTWTRRYAPLFRGSMLTEANSQLPVTPLRARALQEGANPANRGMVEVRLGSSLANQGVPADGQQGTAVQVRAVDMQGNPRPGRTVVTLEASLGRWLGNDIGGTEQGIQAVLENGEGTFTLIAAPQPGVGEVRVTTPDASTTVQVTFVPVNRPMMVTGLLSGRIDWQKLLNGGLGISAGTDGFESALRDWSNGDDSSSTHAGARAALLMKGTVLDDRLLTLSYDSERDRGRTFFRDIAPNEFFPVYGDASIREFDAQSRRRFYARLDKGTSYTMYGDFQTARADDRRVLTAYDRSLTGFVQHLEGRDGSATFFASQGRISQQVDEISGRGISGPYALSRTTGLINSERVEIIVRDRNQPSVILSRTAMTRFADYTIEPVTGRILFRAPVQSLDANLNPISIRVTYETEDGRSKAFWVYGVDGSVRAGERLELGATVARDEGPNTGHALYGVNATAKLGGNTTVFGEMGWTRPEGGESAGAQRVELRHQSSSLEGRLFAVRSDAGYANLSSVFTGGRTEVGGRFSKQLATGTRLIAEGLRSEYGTQGTRREGALVAIERQFSQQLRGEFGYRYARTNEPETSTGVVVSGAPVADRDVSALRARLQYTLPQNTRTSFFGEVEADLRDAERRRAVVGGEYIIASRARLYGRHEFLSGFRDQFTPALGSDRNYTVFGIDADYLKNTQVFSEYRARDAFGGRDAEASIGLRNRWAIAPGLLLNTSFERVSPLLQGVTTLSNQNEALAVAGALEWTKPSLWKSTARLEYRDAFTGDNTLASFGYARKLSRDWTLLGRTLWDDYDAAQRQTRGFSQFGLAWRQTDRNHWNALARYEHRFERLGGLGQALATRDQAHILAAMVNYQPVQRFTFSGRYAGKVSNNRVNGIESDNTAQLLMARGILDLSSRFDAGLITSTLFSEGFSDRRYGLGGELGLILMKNLRVAGGYNIFGFTDKDLNTMGTTRKGPYLELGFKFDESLFGIGGTSSSGGTREKE